MADDFQVRLEGVDELKRALAGAAGKIRKQAVRGALRKAAAPVARAARSAAPVLSAPIMSATRGVIRKPGTVRKAIAIRNSKEARRQGDEAVYVGVKPLTRRGGYSKGKFGKAGKYNPDDPFYWWWLEFGTRRMRARPFLKPAADQQGATAVGIFMREVVPQIEKLNERAARVR